MQEPNIDIMNLLTAYVEKMRKGMPEGWGFYIHLFSKDDDLCRYFVSTTSVEDTIELLCGIVDMLEETENRRKKSQG